MSSYLRESRFSLVFGNRTTFKGFFFGREMVQSGEKLEEIPALKHHHAIMKTPLVGAAQSLSDRHRTSFLLQSQGSCPTVLGIAFGICVVIGAELIEANVDEYYQQAINGLGYTLMICGVCLTLVSCWKFSVFLFAILHC